MKVELRRIDKHFGAVHANDQINLTIEGGTIFGLLGENGAGKSTLMKILSGFFSADAGEISLNDQVVAFHSPADAIARGVGMLHQDPLDFPPMRLVENFILGQRHPLRQHRQAAEKAFRALSAEFGFDLDPQAFVSDLSVGERQQLEIVRLLWLGARTLILDEPTTGISAPQKVKLFSTLRQLAASGKTIIFVSHKLEDVEALCGRVGVLRQGKLVGDVAAPFDPAVLVRMMFTQDISPAARPAVDLGAPAIQLKKVSVSDLRLAMSEISFAIQTGEVVGLAGLEGSGQRLLMQVCAGLLRPAAGEVFIDGRDMTNRPYPAFLKAKVAFMPADRMAEGLVPGLTIAEHFVLTQHRRDQDGSGRLTIDWPVFHKRTDAKIEEYNIKGTSVSRVESLSGGNQQRTLLSLLPSSLRVLIMEHPTRGLDIESALYIWSKLLERRATGTAILFSSADLDELMQYSDRIAVCFGGTVLAVLDANGTSVEELGYLIAGKTKSGSPSIHDSA